MALSRRGFLRKLGGGLAVLGGAILGACDFRGLEPRSRTLEPVFEDTFAGNGPGWRDVWTSFRYGGSLARSDGAGVFRFGPATRMAVRDDRTHTEYMTQPVVVHGMQAQDVAVSCRVRLEGMLEAGVLGRSSFDESYALVVRSGEALLCRYAVEQRHVLARRDLPRDATDFALRLVARGENLRGSVETEGRMFSLAARDTEPLKAGFAGVVGNVLDSDSNSAAFFRSFLVEAADRRSRAEEVLYRFAGAVVPDGASYKARVTARTVIPTDISFEYADNESLDGARRLGPLAPRGRLESVHAWLDDLKGDTTYYWRAVPATGGAKAASTPARFRTPPLAGAASRFVFASCTGGRVTSYSSFSTAAALNPDFYLHAGDWGYADHTSTVPSADHFQARWIRLLRTREVGQLLDASPLMFWQDDHDYKADNGWSATIEPFTVTAFDELHANPGNDYFDVRWGDVHVWCLDCRLHATDPDAPDDENKSRLGFEQKAWLRQGMIDSDAPVKVVASPMVFRNKSPEDPGWHSVYTTERDELLEFFASLEGVVFIMSGDSHGQRLIHHFEFGELYEFNCSGTDFPTGFQPNLDPEHTLTHVAMPAVAVVDLDPAGPNREVKVSVVHAIDGSELFARSFPIG
ncbi:MAG: alkaline phosphatase D family protein [Actinomycetota bacterium]